MPTDFSLKLMNIVHRGLLSLSGGRLGWAALDMPVLKLTTTGRKTGRLHTVMLTSPIQEGTTLVVVASRGGDDQSPAWYLNLQDDPDVSVMFKGARQLRMRARTATPLERARLWPKIVANHTNYAEYQARTSRIIPLVLLEAVS